MAEKARENIGFIQEYNLLEIRIGKPNDNYEELKKLVSTLWTSNLEESSSNHNTPGSSYPNQHNEDWNTKLTNIVNNSLNKCINEFLGKEQNDNNVFVKVVNIEERKGSLIILVTILTNLVSKFEQYGALRRAYDYLVDDIRKVFAPINKNKKVQVRLKKLSNPRQKQKDKSFFNILKSNNFFWNVSGASIECLEESYTDHNKYKNLGAAILFTGLFAAISGGFAISYLTNQWYIILPIALLWGITIINIDMMIVNTMVKYQVRRMSSILGVISRLLLGVAIAFALSIPVEMALLNDEIRDEIERYDRANLENEVQKSVQEFDKIAGLKELKIQKEQFFNEEMQGNPNASGLRGYGPIAKKIELQILDLDNEIKKLEHKKDSTELNLRKELTKSQANNNKFGFLASFRALHRLQYKSEDNSVLYISWGIRVLLLLIELLPIISKLLMSRGAYDSKYELEESRALRLNDKLRKSLP